MMNVVNLTPHAINVQRDDGAFVTFPPSGSVARVETVTTPVYVMERSLAMRELALADGVLVSVQKFGEVTGLPEPEDGTLYIVSAMVRTAVPHRRDVLSPGELIRNDAGQPIGCAGLIAN
jgi:hypothetical protein